MIKKIVASLCGVGAISGTAVGVVYAVDKAKNNKSVGTTITQKQEKNIKWNHLLDRTRNQLYKAIEVKNNKISFSDDALDIAIKGILQKLRKENGDLYIDYSWNYNKTKLTIDLTWLEDGYDEISKTIIIEISKNKYIV